MKYVIDGVMVLRHEQRKFTKEIEAASEPLAKEKLYAILGSNHKLKRPRVKISSIKEQKVV